jgi:ABC-type dipeptide/oligopeptide/nickel transport system permease subunit
MATTNTVTVEPAPSLGAAIMRVIRSFALIRESWVGMIGAGLVIFWVVVAILAPLLAPFDPNATLMPMQRTGALFPGSDTVAAGTFWLGTDQLGRDILSRIIWGSQTVLIYAPLATLSAYTVGILMGLAAGYYRGWVDDLLSRIADIILSFPVLVLYIIIIATIGASGFNIIIAITFASAPGIMRIVRGLVLDLRNRDYVAAAQTRGEGAWRIMLVEILPNARGPLIVDSCLRLGYVIITIGVLGFLGLGLPPPDPDWGGMINETRSMAMAFPHMVLYPCFAISSLILGFNLLADGLREISLRD